MVRHSEGKDLRAGGFTPEMLTLIAAQPVIIDGEPRLLKLHAEQLKGGWKVWVCGAPRNFVRFEGPLTGHGWRRPESSGVYSRPGVVKILSPAGPIELELV